ncbi:MAG: hypothetical protein JJU36_17875 [Phycisphaeraceae bacterium]|nr:hypothetical protein [Phycisphaeraceae bacterium]
MMLRCTPVLFACLALVLAATPAAVEQEVISARAQDTSDTEHTIGQPVESTNESVSVGAEPADSHPVASARELRLRIIRTMRPVFVHRNLA